MYSSHGRHVTFQSTLSVRRATQRKHRSSPQREFQSTLSVRRATQAGRCQILEWDISIHALREESDVDHGRFHGVCGRVFQSTLSVRRATAQMDSMFHIVEHLSFVQVQE